MLLFVTDLDNTLVYSHKLLGPEGAVEVDYYNGAPCCYMTQTGYERLQRINPTLTFVPLTTRSLEQYLRMKLLDSGLPEWALTSNGGILLHNGEIDRQWLTETQQLITPAMEQLEQAMELLERDTGISRRAELVDGMFVFAKSEDMEKTVQLLTHSLEEALVTIFAQQEKLYVLPRMLTKGLAVRRLRERFGPCTVLSAGDSEFDLPMLEEADLAFAPDDLPGVSSGLQHIQIVGGERVDFGDAVLAEIEVLANRLALRPDAGRELGAVPE